MLSTKPILKKVLEEVWNGKKPSIFELKIYGCMPITTSLQEKKKKKRLDLKVDACYNVDCQTVIV
jgi:hypothetical protein